MKINPITLFVLTSALTLGTSSLVAGDQAAVLTRGKYLVENIGLCADCHSPRDQRGQFVREHWLKGAPLGFAATVPMPAWGGVAPGIAGLPTYTDAQAVKFFMTGQKPDGTTPRPPMPEYRFNEEDARAVTAYLRSLGQTAAAVPAPAAPTKK